MSAGSQNVATDDADVDRREARKDAGLVDEERYDRHVCRLQRGSGGQRHRRHRGRVRRLLAASLHHQHAALLLSRLPSPVPSHRHLHRSVPLQLRLEPGAVRVGSSRLSSRAT